MIRVAPTGGHGTDTHVHVLDPARFAYAPQRRYTPAPATVADLWAHLDRLGLRRVVCVQPSVYGHDNRCLLDALQQLGPDARGIAVLGADECPQAVVDLIGHSAGRVAGVRLNLAVNRSTPLDEARRQIERTVQQIAGTSLHLQLHVPWALLPPCLPMLGALDCPVVLDHFALAPVHAVGTVDGWAPLLQALADQPALWVKLSAPYQVSHQGPPYAEVTSLARALIGAAPERMLWGSDWPHPAGAHRRPDAPIDTVEPFRTEDDAALLALLHDWAPNPALHHQILADNPARLFGWSAR
jgi:2-pyrone-4,6-dicarboxylate lactonase